jgi:hypothetical protein
MKTLHHHFYSFILLIFLCNPLNAQYSFELWLNSDIDEYPRDMIMNSTDNYVGIIRKTSSTDYRVDNYIYKIDTFGDTTSRAFIKPDTIMLLDKIIQVSESPIEYLVVGTGYHQDSSASLWFSYFMKIDNNLNIIWEKVYHLHQVNENPFYPIYSQLLKLVNGGYLHANNLVSYRKMFLFEMSESGDSVAYRMYEGDSTGYTLGLTYNPDSTSYWLHISGGQYEPNGPECQCVEINMQLEQTAYMNYPRYFHTEYTTKLLPFEGLVTASTFFNPFPKTPEEYIAAFKLDNNFNVIGECMMTSPDTANDGGYKMLDFICPTKIYFGGDFNHQIGIWVPGPTWFVIGTLNEEFELENELYIGGDATYNLKTITATADTGVLISGTWYDYSSESYERDVIILKLSKDELITGQTEQETIPVSTVILYPNPGNNNLNIRTTQKGVQFKMWDMERKLVIDQKINQKITSINTSSLKTGAYSWQLLKDEKIVDAGKWIRTN